MTGRFAISMHILTLLAKANGEWLPSDLLAGSININPVLVRKELINLRNKGLVVSREGKYGEVCWQNQPLKFVYRMFSWPHVRALSWEHPATTQIQTVRLANRLTNIWMVCIRKPKRPSFTNWAIPHWRISVVDSTNFFTKTVTF